MPYRKFNELLAMYRERQGISKTELAKELNVFPQYIMNIEKGVQKAPTVERCKEIARILELNKKETEAIVDSAMEERLPQEAIEWLHEKESFYKKMCALCTDDIIEALKDPIAKKALLKTHNSSEHSKEIIKEVIETIPHISKEKRKEILKRCHSE